jgi:hypothetical protein
MVNQNEIINSELFDMSVQQLMAYKNFYETLFERVRDTHFAQNPLPDQVPDAWHLCVKTIDAIQMALYLKQQ